MAVEEAMKMAEEVSGVDTWRHRSMRMSCATCMYYVPKESWNGGQIVGRCRRHSPTMSGWPVMRPTDWCGDHKLDENKA